MLLAVQNLIHSLSRVVHPSWWRTVRLTAIDIGMDRVAFEGFRLCLWGVNGDAHDVARAFSLLPGVG